MNDRPGRIVELFQAVLDLDAEARSVWLRDACEGESELAEVEELLALHDSSGDGEDELETSAEALREVADELWNEPLPEKTVIGQYCLDRVLASGGMGTVYVAEQSSPLRRVALKVLSGGLEAGAAKQRFDYESQILAHLQHPGIAQVHECGTVEIAGRTIPWFAMELVEGALSLTKYADAETLSLSERLALVRETCAAVHYGHQMGVVHRDLKPDNILVDQQGRIKVIDFGIAKATDADLGLMTLQTHADQLLGTMSYMSPEQSFGDGRSIDTRSDVYSLGVILFELLTGRLPHDFAGLSIMASVRVLADREVDMRPLARADLPSDVRTIVRKALAKDRDNRYDSASALADDIGRFRRGEPIAARAPSTWYQFSRFAARNRLLVAAVVGGLLVLVLGVAGTTVGFLRATDARGKAEVATADALWGRDFLAEMLFEADPWRGHGPQVSIGDALRRASGRLEANLPAANVEAGIRGIFGEVHLRLGDHAEALVHMRRAIELRRGGNVLNEPHALLMGIGVVQALAGQGELVAAEAEARVLIAAHLRFYGEGHVRNARAEDALAQVLVAGHRHEEAISIYRTVLVGLAPHAASESKFIAVVQNNLAQALHRGGEYREAGNLFRTVLDFRSEVLGANHPSTLITLNNLAGVLFEQGLVAEAVPFFERALATQEDLLGAMHGATLTTVGNLATAMRNLGELEKAEELSRRAWMGRAEVLGADHSDTLVSMSNLAVALMGLGVRGLKEGGLERSKELFGEAEALLRDCLRKRTAIETRPSGLRARIHGSLGNVLLCVGDASGAYSHYSQAVEIAEGTWGDSRWETWLFRAGLGRAAFGLGRLDEARKLLKESEEAIGRLRPGHAVDHTIKAWRRQLESRLGK